MNLRLEIASKIIAGLVSVDDDHREDRHKIHAREALRYADELIKLEAETSNNDWKRV